MVSSSVSTWQTYLKGSRPVPKLFVPGVMMQWEMMVGHSQTRWHWGSPIGAAEPAIPWDAHLFPDGTPVSFTEAAAIREYTTGKNDFIAVETYLDETSLNAPEAYLTIPQGSAHILEPPQKGLLAAGGGALYEMSFWPEAINGTLRVRIGELPSNGDDDEAPATAGSTAPPPAPPFLLTIDANATDQTLRTLATCGTHSGGAATYDMRKEGKPEGGLLVGAWNLLRVLIEHPPSSSSSSTEARVRVWFNPQFPDVTGASVAMPPYKVVPMPPRIDVKLDASIFKVKAGSMMVEAAGGSPQRVDYMGILPPVLYGLAGQTGRQAGRRVR